MNHRVHPRLLKPERVRRCQLDECQAACCLHGTWIDQAEINDILSNAHLIALHMPPGMTNPDDWFDERRETDRFSISGEAGHTTVLPTPDHYGGTACIFLRPDHKCALQTAAGEAGVHPWRFKPFYCILHPLDLDDQGRITLDDIGLILAEPGSCLRPAERPIPLIETFVDELRYLLGEEYYSQLKPKP